MNTGLLAFLYYLKSLSTVQQAFRQDATAVMNQFNLSDEAQKAVRAAGTQSDDEHLEPLVRLLIDELQASYTSMW